MSLSNNKCEVLKDYQNENGEMKEGYTFKAFNSKLQGWGGYQYEVGKTYEIPEEELEICKRGYHSCYYPYNVWNFYARSNSNRYALVKVEKKIVKHINKIASNKITIVKEISVDEFMTLSGLFKDEIKNITQLKNGVKVYTNNGVIENWYNNEGQLHRIDKDKNGYTLPAVINRKGEKEWWVNGNRHRDERDSDGEYLPALIYLNYKYWYINGTYIKHV